MVQNLLHDRFDVNRALSLLTLVPARKKSKIRLTAFLLHSRVGLDAGQHLMEHHTHRKDVARTVAPETGINELRGHVVERSGKKSGCRRY